MTCSKCGTKIKVNTDYLVQDKTGAKLCMECGEHFYDVTTAHRACSCSRGGNAMYCECQEELAEMQL